MHPDSFYETWPRELTDFDRESGAYGRCLSPREELACFLTTRGHCLLSNGWRDEAIECLRWSVELAPHDKRYQLQLDSIVNQGGGWSDVPAQSQYRGSKEVRIPYGRPIPAGLPSGVVIKYVTASELEPVPGHRPEAQRIFKLAAGRPRPACLPPGTPAQIVPANQADDLSAFAAPLRSQHALPQNGRTLHPTIAWPFGRPGINGLPSAELPSGLPGN